MKQVLKGLLTTALRKQATKLGAYFHPTWLTGGTIYSGVLNLDEVADDVDAGLSELHRACSREVSPLVLMREDGYNPYGH